MSQIYLQALINSAVSSFLCEAGEDSSQAVKLCSRHIFALTAKSANNPKEPIINAKDLVAKHLKRKLAELRDADASKQHELAAALDKQAERLRQLSRELVATSAKLMGQVECSKAVKRLVRMFSLPPQTLKDWESSRRKRAGKGSPSPRARKRKSPEAGPPPPPGRSRLAGAVLAGAGSPAGTAAAPRRPPGAPQLAPKRLFVGEQRRPLSLLASPPAVGPAAAAGPDLGASIMDLAGLTAGVPPSERSNGGAQAQPPAVPGSSTPAVQSERQLSLLRSGGAPQRHRRKPAAPTPAMAEVGAAPPWQVFMGSLHEPAQQPGARRMHSGEEGGGSSSDELAGRQPAGARGSSAMDTDVPGVQAALTEEELDLAVALLLGTERSGPTQGSPHPTVLPEAPQPVQRRSPSSGGGGAGTACAAVGGPLASSAAGEVEISNAGAAAAAAAEAWVAPQQAAPQLGSLGADRLECAGIAQDVLQGVGYSGPLDMCTDAAQQTAAGAVPLAARALSPAPVTGVLQPAAQDSGSSTRKRSSSGGSSNSRGSSSTVGSSPRRRRGSINPLGWGTSSGSSTSSGSQASLRAAEEGEEEEGPALRPPANLGKFGIEVGCKLMAVDRAALHLRQRGLAGCGRASPPSADRAAVALGGLSLRQRRDATLGRPLELSYAPGSGRAAAVVAVGR